MLIIYILGIIVSIAMIWDGAENINAIETIVGIFGVVIIILLAVTLN